MDKFVKQENILHYRRLLERTTDEAEKARIAKLLADEKQRESSSPPHRPPKEART